MTDVTIPQDVAKDAAELLREAFPSERGGNEDANRLADLLDPPSPSLREQVAEAMVASGDDAATVFDADAVLTVVANWLAAQPLAPRNGAGLISRQRDHDVRLIRGEAS